jgi:predicted alpha/beta superfamily hydrolase
MKELTTFKNEKYGVGNHASYLDFIVIKLKTLIDKKYRTKTTKKNTLMMGSSLGELVFFMPFCNAYMCLEKEGVF